MHDATNLVLIIFWMSLEVEFIGRLHKNITYSIHNAHKNKYFDFFNSLMSQIGQALEKSLLTMLSVPLCSV